MDPIGLAGIAATILTFWAAPNNESELRRIAKKCNLNLNHARKMVKLAEALRAALVEQGQALSLLQLAQDAASQRDAAMDSKLAKIQSTVTEILRAQGENEAASQVAALRPQRGGDVKLVRANVSAGDGVGGKGGDATIAGGDGPSGGDVTLIGGTFKAGDAGPGGSGGNLVIRGGDAT